MTVALNKEPTIRVAIPRWALAAKFVIDYFVGLVVLFLATIPLIIVNTVYLLVFHGGAWPMKVERRVGKNGKVFRFFKLRITDRKGNKTALGEWLRHWGLDETPQVLCFFLRTMTLVGPRPHWVSEHEENLLLNPQWWERTLVLPGMLGLGIGKLTNTAAQAASITNKRLKRLPYDLRYIGEWTIGLELLCYRYCIRDMKNGHEPKLCCDAPIPYQVPAGIQPAGTVSFWTYS